MSKQLPPGYGAGRIDTFVWMFERGEPLTKRQHKRWDVANNFWHNHSERRSRRSRRKGDGS